MPRISVVMSVYNGQPYLSEAVRSVLDQTYGDFEFIVIDDASTDATWQELSAFANADPRIVLLQNARNQGYTRSLNRGLAVASGEFVARQDADDISHPERFARQIEYLDAHPDVGLLGTLPAFIDATGGAVAPSSRVLKTDNESLQADLLDTNGIWHGSVMIRRHLLDMVGPYDPGLEPAEDYDMWLRLAEKTRIANLGARLYRYRVHDASESQRRRAVQIFHKAQALERALRRRHGSSPPTSAMRLLSRDFLRAAVAGCASDPPAERASEWAARAIDLDAGITADLPLIEGIVQPYLRRLPTAAAVDLLGLVFGVMLPASKPLATLNRRLLSEVYMQEVSYRLSAGRASPLEHFWPAVRLRPRAVMHRHTWSLLGRGLRAAARTAGNRATPDANRREA